MVLLENKSEEHKVTIENNEDSTMNEEKPKLKVQKCHLKIKAYKILEIIIQLMMRGNKKVI